MILCTLYNLSTGRLTRQLMLPTEAELNENIVSGEAWVAGLHDLNTMRVVDGQVVPRDQADLEAEEIAQAWADLKDLRSRKLYACDWTQVPDAPVDQAAWAVYRQELRDLPQNTVDPRYPVWPTPPK